MVHVLVPFTSDVLICESMHSRIHKRTMLWEQLVEELVPWEPDVVGWAGEPIGR